MQPDMKRYVEALCASARFRIAGGILLEHDLTWDRGGGSSPGYYHFAAQDLTCRDPPLPTKTERTLWSHGTDVGALCNMLKDRGMLPMNAFGVAKFN